MRTDTGLSVDFLEAMCPGGPWVLTRIRSDMTGIDTVCLPNHHDVEQWLLKYNGSEKENIYFTHNSVMDGIPFESKSLKKLNRSHIKSMDFLHVDVDPDHGKPIEEEQKRIIKLLQNPPGLPKPTFLIFTGGGYQAFWRLDNRFYINGDEQKYEEAKLYNLAIEQTLNADSCHNVDRVMRLPGTINWPTQRKLAKGRVPAMARLIEHHTVSYDLDTFKKAQSVASKARGLSGGTVQVSGNVKRLNSVDELGPDIKPDTKAIIVQGANAETATRQHDSRSDAVWYVVCELVRGNIDDDTVYSVITDPDFIISEHVLAQPRPHEYALRQIERAHEFAEDPLLMELNEQYALIKDMDGGKCKILKRTYDEATGRMIYGFQSMGDFKNSLIKLEVGTGKTAVPASMWWLKHPKGRQYEGIVFSPGQEPPTGYLNQWEGFAYPAVQGNWQLLKEHILDNVCQGNDEHYEYLMNWLARGVQFPSEPGQVAVVLRGRQGVGKSFLAKMYGKLWGNHYWATSSAKQITGQFTGHLRGIAFLLGDEAFVANDPAHVAALKTLITEDVAVYEKKGVDAANGRNCIKLMLASNDDWVVKADGLERRFLVLDVGEGQIQNSKYFGRIADQMEHGGYQAMMYEMAHRDITKFNVYEVPKTKGMGDQQVMSMHPLHEWFYDCLARGRILHNRDWDQPCPLETLTFEANKFFRSGESSTTLKVGNFLSRKLLVTTSGQTTNVGVVDPKTGREEIKKVATVHSFKSLSDCRAAWEQVMGFPVTVIEQEMIVARDEEDHKDF